MWSECVLTAVYLINRLPSSVLSGKSPYEIMYNIEPNISHLKVFGCLCFATVLNNSDKFSSRSEKSVFIGYSFEKKGYKLFSLESKKILFSRDVTFYETVFPFKNKSENKDFEFHFQNTDSLNFFNHFLDDEHLSDEPYDEKRDKKPKKSEDIDPLSLRGTENTGFTKKGEGVHPSESAEAANDEEENVTLEENVNQSEGDDNFYNEFNNLFKEPVIVTPSKQSNLRTYVRRSDRKTQMPVKLSDYEVDTKVKYNIDKHVNYSKLNTENYNFSTSLNKIREPKTYKEAATNPKWIEAMNLEVEALNRNETWDEITELPVGRKAIRGKWVFKIKYKSNGEIERYKARWVAKGYNKKEGVYYDETFSPVVKIVTVRCLLSVAVQHGWSVFQMDVNNAFLYGELDEDVYMCLPEGYCDVNDTRVCKLKKSLYGLKQAPRKWNEKLTSVLIENGFEQSKNDFSLFIKNKNGIFIALLVYVDDIVITGNNVQAINEVKAFMGSKFLIKDLGKLKYFLGIEVLNSDGNMFLTQRKYCLELLAEFGMLACKPCNTPIETKECSAKPDQVIVDVPLTGITNYQKLVGKLIYLTHTRPDISYAVHVLSQYMHAPMQSHLKLAFRVLRYLKNAPGQGISFYKGNNLDINVFVDSDWAKCKVTRKSVTGYCVFLGKSLVSWKSKKQSMLSKSSAEAEYRAMNSVTCEVIWIQKILTEMNIKTSLPVPLHCDNSSAIQIAANPVFHEKTKHFEIELFFLREKVAAGVVKTVKVKSVDNVTDIFTKGLSAQEHKKFCDGLGLYDMYKAEIKGECSKG